MSTSITSTPSKMDIYSKLTDIAKKYIDSDSDVDYLNAGLFGYLTEALAMMTRDSAYHKTMLYNESFLNTAVIPESVYNWAKMFNLDVNVASPAYAEINIIIPREKLSTNNNFEYEDYNIDDTTGNSTVAIIDKSNQIIAGDYYFALEHSILITKASEGTSTYLAKYLSDSNEKKSTSYQAVNTSSYLPVSYDGTNVIISARAYQYKITTISRQLSSSTMRNKIQTFTFEDQFAAARLYYKEFSSADEEEITLRYSNVGNSTTSKYAFYNLVSDNELEIAFKAGSGGFVPAPNAVVTIEIYSTKGANIPTKYSGDAYFRTNDENLKNLTAVIQFNPTTLIGGKNAPTTDEIKQTIIRNLSTCNTIVTESDLNNYFGILTGLLETINDGQVTFVKRRDDIMRRIFTAYVLLRDGLDENGEEMEDESTGFISRCIPTNTITATFPYAMFSGDNTLIYPRMVLNSSTGKYRGMLANESETNYYFSPFYIYVSTAPIKHVKYIYNLTDDSSPIACTNVSGDTFGTTTDTEGTVTALYANPLTLSITRGLGSEGSAESSYTFTMQMTSNMTADQFNTKVSSIEISYKNDSTSQTVLKTIEMSRDMITQETSSTEENVYVLNVELTVDVSDTEFDFQTVNNSYGETIRLLNENDEEKLVMESNTFIVKVVKDTGNYVEYTTENELRLFRSLDEVMYSDLQINYSTTDIENTIQYESVTISDIPVIHSSYFTNAKIEDDFIEQMFTYIDILEENIGKLETNTFFDLKFYNSHGVSKLYNTTTTNIDLEMVIHLDDTVSTYTTESQSSLQTEIRSYIRRLIDKMNDDGKITISKVISQLQRDETYGDYINYVEFKGLNGTFGQAITAVDATEEYIAQYPPEWINIDRDSIEDIEFVVDS